jgi:hypothetical protein
VTTITNPVTITDGAGAVNVICDSGCSGGAQYTEDAAAAADPVGGALNLIRADTPGTLTTTDGDNVALRGTNYGAAYVTLLSSAGVLLTPSTDATVGSAGPASGPFIQASYKDFDGSALPTTTNVNTEEEATPIAASIVGVQYVMLTTENGALSPMFADDVAFTPGTSVAFAVGGQADETSTDSVDEGDFGAFRISLDRLLYTRMADPCSGGATKLYLPFDITTATTTEITPSLAGASTHYYICALNILTTAANNVNLVDDNTDGCGSVTASLISTGLAAGDGWGFAANGGLALGNGLGSIMRTQTTNSVLCLVTSAATELHGQFVVVAAP